MPRSSYLGYIKEYEGATLMEVRRGSIQKYYYLLLTGRTCEVSSGHIFSVTNYIPVGYSFPL